MRKTLALLLAVLLAAPMFGADLTGTTPQNTYKDLVQLPNSNAGIDATLRQLQSGNGAAWPLWMSTTNGKFAGVLGTDVIVNGTFAADTVWTKGTNWTIGSGVAAKSVGTASTLAQTASTIVAGTYYKLTFDVPTLTASTITPSGGGWTGDAIATAATGIVRYFYATTTGALTFSATATTVGTVDNVILQAVSSSFDVADAYITSSTWPLTFKKTLNGATGNQVAYSLDYETNKAAGNDTGLEINMTDTASPGTSRLFDAKVGGASKFYVDADGTVVLSTPGITTTGTTAVDIKTPLLSGTASKIQVKLSGSYNNSTAGAQYGTIVFGLYNQASGTASNTDLLVSRTELAVGSGAQYLIDAQVGAVSKFSVTNTGVTTASQYRLSALNTAPANAGDTGTAGEIRIAADYIYVCVATNTWKRVAIATW